MEKYLFRFSSANGEYCIILVSACYYSYILFKYILSALLDFLDMVAAISKS